VAGIDKIAGVLECEHRVVMLGALAGLVAMGGQNLVGLNGFVAKEAIGGLGLCPIRACLVDGAFRRV
jgi:hypothetical protein